MSMPYWCWHQLPLSHHHVCWHDAALSITYRTLDPMKAIKGHINGGWFPRTHQGCISCPEILISCLEILHDYYLKYLVSCSSTKRFFTPSKKMMAHQWPIKRLFWPSKGCSGPSIAHQGALPGTK